MFLLCWERVFICLWESEHMNHKHMMVRVEQQTLDSLNRTISLSLSLFLKGSINRGASSISHLHSSAGLRRSQCSFLPSFSLLQPLTSKTGFAFQSYWHQICWWNSSWLMWHTDLPPHAERERERDRLCLWQRSVSRRAVILLSSELWSLWIQWWWSSVLCGRAFFRRYVVFAVQLWENTVSAWTGAGQLVRLDYD